MIDKTLEKISQYLQRFETVFGVVTIASIVLITLVQVFFRYVLRSSLLWTPELTKVVFIWMTFIMSASTLRYRRHLRVDSFVSLLPQKAQLILSIIVHLIILVIAWFFLNYGIEVSQRVANTQIPSLGVSRSFVVLPLAIGGGLIAVSSIHNMIEDFLQLRRL